ncbi:MAG TPA: uracil-DNA glycosylase family protein, partial [Blastocatellia bacterium]|nr:uracil-DNA glycosylase family protein [Blastocatellia bacterium]
MSDAREEFGWLLAQAREHLLYYRDLGLTHIGEERKPATTEPLPAQTVETPRPTSPPPEVKTPEPSIIETPPPAFPKQEITMAKAKESQPAAMPSLFGEVAAAPTAAPVNETLEDIRLDLGECQRCKLWQTRTNIVFGEGNPKAELMFIGEAPGADEDATGRPFVGRAGQLLTKM